MRNYYSTTAALRGLTLGCFHSEELDGLYKMINPHNNYQGYRNMMLDSRSALHFLVPMEQDIQLYGDSSTLVLVLGASKSYSAVRAFIASCFK